MGGRVGRGGSAKSSVIEGVMDSVLGDTVVVIVAGSVIGSLVVSGPFSVVES